MHESSERGFMRKQMLKHQIRRIPPYLHVQLKFFRLNTSGNAVALYAAILWLDKFKNDIAVINVSIKGLRASRAYLTIRLII